MLRREEFGARALGNRSIIADPRNESVKKKLMKKLKIETSGCLSRVCD